MKKMMTMVAAALFATAAFAGETRPELEEMADSSNWRLMVGGFGRGNIRSKVSGFQAEFSQVYGVDIDLQYKVWENENFALWAGIGGAYSPRQGMGRGHSRTSSSEYSSEEGTSITTDVDTDGRASAKLEYGEFRLMVEPEWKATERFSLGARLGVAFDWMHVKCSRHNRYAWRSHTVTDMSALGMDPIIIDLDGAEDTEWSDSQTEFAAQGIVGIQGTYMFTDTFGLYANCDWRIGGKTDFKKGGETYASVDMSGWYAGFGVVFSF